jgi:hypothetical protein
VAGQVKCAIIVDQRGNDIGYKMSACLDFHNSKIFADINTYLLLSIKDIIFMLIFINLAVIYTAVNLTLCTLNVVLQELFKKLCWQGSLKRVYQYSKCVTPE